MRFREKLAQFMYGRRGMDQLSIFLVIVALALTVIYSFIASVIPEVVGTIIRVLSLVIMVWVLYRMFSRDIYRRSKENDWYLKRRNAVKRWFRSLKDRWIMRRDYKFFRCPSCHTLLRVPRGKGKIQLTCRKCGSRFERKS